MQYISTRGHTEPMGFSDAVLTGLAPDGGLLIPEHIPDVSDRLARWQRLDYPSLAEEIFRLYTDIPSGDLRPMIRDAYASFDTSEVTPVVPVGGIYVLELFHGPTLAFKDVALQWLGRLFEHILRQRGARLNILAATSGDTGSAAIYGVRGRRNINIFVMHPHRRVSPIQEKQMTSVLDPNVFNIAVQGTFDDCQAIMKSIFRDLDFKQRYSLGAVNSVNWARVLAQMVYYFYAAFRVMERTGASQVRFAVPTGNFGDILAGYYAARMGLPVGKLVLATNQNDILARFFNTGEYRRSEVVTTLSPAMDIQVASNFERYLYYRLGEDPARVGELMEQFARTGRLRVPLRAGTVDPLFASRSADRAATLDTIRRYYEMHGYLLDPHTAVGVFVAEQFQDENQPMICLATAHPAKFPEAVFEAVGRDIARHPAVEALKGKPTRCEVLPAEEQAIRNYISSRGVSP